jgi:hypothetical protein
MAEVASTTRAQLDIWVKESAYVGTKQPFGFRQTVCMNWIIGLNLCVQVNMPNLAAGKIPHLRDRDASDPKVVRSAMIGGGIDESLAIDPNNTGGNLLERPDEVCNAKRRAPRFVSIKRGRMRVRACEARYCAGSLRKA